MLNKHLKYEAIKHETDKAYLFDLDGFDVWLPKSQVKIRADQRVCVPLWLAYRKQQDLGVHLGISEGDVKRAYGSRRVRMSRFARNNIFAGLDYKHLGDPYDYCDDDWY